MSPHLDPELQQALARDGLAALDQLLTAQPVGERIDCHRVGALVRLIWQASSVPTQSGKGPG